MQKLEKMAIPLSCQRKLAPRFFLITIVTLINLLCIHPTLATVSNNLYDAKGNMIASCGEEGCEYFLYQAVSRVGVVKNNQFTHQANGIDGKSGEIVRSQNSVQSTQLWITDFHGSVISKLTTEESETILFDAFGAVLNEEDCKDYHYTDKPRIGCTKLHNFNVRSYDPTLGRFIITDPVEQSNLNWFIYVNNNPTQYTDPTGQWAVLVFRIAQAVVPRAVQTGTRLCLNNAVCRDAAISTAVVVSGFMQSLVSNEDYFPSRKPPSASSKKDDGRISVLPRVTIDADADSGRYPVAVRASDSASSNSTSEFTDAERRLIRDYWRERDPFREMRPNPRDANYVNDPASYAADMARWDRFALRMVRESRELALRGIRVNLAEVERQEEFRRQTDEAISAMSGNTVEMTPRPQ